MRIDKFQLVSFHQIRGGGLNRFDPQTETFTAYRHRAGDVTSLSHEWVMALLETRDGTFWVSTAGGGLNRFDPSTGTFTAYRHRAGDPTSTAGRKFVPAWSYIVFPDSKPSF